jgi:Fe-S oxidoreductase
LPYPIDKLTGTTILPENPQAAPPPGERAPEEELMKVGLFIPCYIDAFFPEVGVATLELLERPGCSVEYPLDQTCCGQPMANSGCPRASRWP